MLYAIQIIASYSNEIKVKAHFVEREEKTLSYEEFDALKTISGKEYDLWETVTIRLGGMQYVMLVEESGKFKDLPVNILATALYANPVDAIIGDAWLVGFDGIEDLTYLDDAELKIFTATTRCPVEVVPLKFS